MSKILAEQKVRLEPSLIEIAQSSLKIEIEDLLTATLPFEFSSEKIRLMEFLDVYWSLKIRCTGTAYVDYIYKNSMYFDFAIVGFPEELKKDCLIEFSCVETGMKSTIPYQTLYSYGVFYNNINSFTVKLSVRMKMKPRTLKDTTLELYTSRKQLLDRISGTYGDETLSDFTFIVKGKEFKVHKSILAASSAVMRKMFTADYEEKKTGQCKIANIEPDIFEVLIRFMYTCEAPENLSEIAAQLFEVAHYYEVESLKNVCSIEIQNSLSVENATKAYRLAFKYDLKELLVDAWKIVKRDFLKIYLPDEFEPLPPWEVDQIIALRKAEKAIYKKYTKVKAEAKDSK